MATLSLRAPAETAILIGEEPGQVRIYAWGAVRIIVWDATPTVRGAQTLRRVLESHRKTALTQSAVVVITKTGLPLPDAETRDELVHAHRLFDATAFVIEHEGFVASSVRAAITSVMLVTGKRQSVRMTSSLLEAARWLADAHARGAGVSFDAAHLASALAVASRR